MVCRDNRKAIKIYTEEIHEGQRRAIKYRAGELRKPTDQLDPACSDDREVGQIVFKYRSQEITLLSCRYDTVFMLVLQTQTEN